MFREIRKTRMALNQDECVKILEEDKAYIEDDKKLFFYDIILKKYS